MKKNNHTITGTKSKKRKRIVIVALLTVFVVYVAVGFWNTGLQVTHYEYRSSKLPQAFEGYRIVVVSDLHHKNFGSHQSELLERIRAAKPDMIALTGDIVDEKHTNMTSTEDFLRGISQMAPVYYVNGNHELDRDAKFQYEQLLGMLEEYGITNLNGKEEVIERQGQEIMLTGVAYSGDNIVNRLAYADESKFNILLYHCSDAFGKISSYGYDIILSGHTHGGVVRLPFVGGVFGNARDFFPKYAGGVFMEHQSTLFSSRGLGDAEIPRFYNPPEIVVVTLHCA